MALINIKLFILTASGRLPHVSVDLKRVETSSTLKSLIEKCSTGSVVTEEISNQLNTGLVDFVVLGEIIEDGNTSIAALFCESISTSDEERDGFQSVYMIIKPNKEINIVLRNPLTGCSYEWKVNMFDTVRQLKDRITEETGVSSIRVIYPPLKKERGWDSPILEDDKKTLEEYYINEDGCIVLFIYYRKQQADE